MSIPFGQIIAVDEVEGLLRPAGRQQDPGQGWTLGLSSVWPEGVAPGGD